MNEPRKHHHLPVFYLDRWAKAESKVVRYYRPHKAVVARPISPKHTGYEIGLYELEGYSAKRNNSIEREFMAQRVDGPASEAIAILIERANAKLKPVHRFAWARFVLSLLVRSPAKVKEISGLAEQGLQETFSAGDEEYAAIRSEGDPATLYQWVVKNAHEVMRNHGKNILPGIITHPSSNDAFVRMRWGTYQIREEEGDFLTGDRPVYMSHGLMDERCVVAVPLAPNFLFIASRSADVLEHFVSAEPRVVANLTNESIVGQAHESVYGAHARHLKFVEDRLRPIQPA